MKITLITLITAMISLSACASTNFSPKKTVVYLHGANFTAKSWSLVTSELLEFKNYTINLSGRKDNLAHKDIDLEFSAKALCLKLEDYHEDLTFVVHSQAGAILNHSLGLCPSLNIKKIIYISAVIPLDKEKVFSKLNKQDEENYFSGIKYEEALSSLVISDNEKFVYSFSGDVSKKESKFILSSTVAEPAPIGEGIVKLNDKKFNSIEKFYIKTLQDKIISIDSQRKITKDIQFEATYSINSGHLPMVTNFKELSQIIRTILN